MPTPADQGDRLALVAPWRWRRRDNAVKAQFLTATGAADGFRDGSVACRPASFHGSKSEFFGEGRGPIRERRLALRPGAGGPARPHVPDRAAFLPVSHRPVRRRQDLAA